MVKRYDVIGLGYSEVENGPFVMYSDYADLLRRVKAARALIRPVNHAVGMDHVAILDFDRLLPEGKEE